MKSRTVTTVLACLFTTLLGCSGTTELPNKSGQLYVNLNTGETQVFGDGESVPPDYAVCSGEGCPEPYPCTEIDPASCEVRPDCVPGSVPGCDPSSQDCSSTEPSPGTGGGYTPDDDVSVCANVTPTPCDPSECSDEFTAIARICDDGSVGTPVCERVANGTCDYVHRCDDDCGPDDCGPIPEIAMICPDGSVGEPVCERTSAGVCGVGFQCGGVVSSPSCEPVDCGPAPAIAKICPNGSAAEMVCAPDANQACAWGFDCSGTIECKPSDCGGLNYIGHTCPDGSTADPHCMATMDGLCEWTPVCPL